MNIAQMADFMNVSVATVQNRIYAKNMPFPVYKEGSGYFADVHDVASYHDRMRRDAAAAHAAIAAALR